MKSKVAKKDPTRWVRDLVQYKGLIGRLHRANGKWATYDRTFRKWVQSSGARYSQVRYDLYLSCLNSGNEKLDINQGQKKSDFRKDSAGGSIASTSSGSSMVPKGYCQKYHDVNKRCDNIATCPYKHECPRCHLKHPMSWSCATFASKAI